MEGNGMATATAGGPAFDSLPPELLETICGFLDVGTLCTARLVSTKFCGAASTCIHSVELSVENLRSRPETNLNNFPNLSRVCVFGLKEDDLLLLARSPVADAVTHVQAGGYLRPVPQIGQPHSLLQPLPNLVSLTVVGYRVADRPFPFPQTLRELTLGHLTSDRTATFVAGLTNLTSLRLDKCHGRMPPFEGLTALTALRRLEIQSVRPSILYVGELTRLTHLRIKETQMGAWSSDLARASLTRLQSLVHLDIGLVEEGLEAEVLASIGTMTSLRSLHLHLRGRPARSAFETVCMVPFSHLTALRLETDRAACLDASFLPRFNLERLQYLSLSSGVELDRDGVAALRRATGLTNLELWTRGVGAAMGSEELGVALLHMPRLRALSLGTTAAFQATSCPRAIAPLTELTRLRLCGPRITTYADAEACLGLKKLRVLTMRNPERLWPAPADRVLRETVYALARLPELRKLDIGGHFGILRHDLSARDRAWLNTTRHKKGWPPLEWDNSRYWRYNNTDSRLLWGCWTVSTSYSGASYAILWQPLNTLFLGVGTIHVGVI